MRQLRSPVLLALILVGCSSKSSPGSSGAGGGGGAGSSTSSTAGSSSSSGGGGSTTGSSSSSSTSSTSSTTSTTSSGGAACTGVGQFTCGTTTCDIAGSACVSAINQCDPLNGCTDCDCLKTSYLQLCNGIGTFTCSGDCASTGFTITCQ